MTRKRLILAAAVLTVGAGVLFGAWSAYLRPVKVQVAAVQRDVAVEVFGLGTVEARVTSKIGFKVAGVLVELRADVGDRVAKGAVLARLDDREQRAQVARANAAIEQAEANLQRAKASVGKGQSKLRQRQQHQPASADAATEQQHLGRNGTDGEGGRRRYTRRPEFGEQRCRWWRRPI